MPDKSPQRPNIGTLTGQGNRHIRGEGGHINACGPTKRLHLNILLRKGLLEQIAMKIEHEWTTTLEFWESCLRLVRS
jgi:hypothetical protein